MPHGRTNHGHSTDPRAARASRPPSSTEETTASIAVLLRVVPPPKALLVCRTRSCGSNSSGASPPTCSTLNRSPTRPRRCRRFHAEFRPVVLTDSLEMVRKLRTRQPGAHALHPVLRRSRRCPEREAGLVAGADECVGRRASAREIDARVALRTAHRGTRDGAADHARGEPQAIGDGRSDPRRQPAFLQQALSARESSVPRATAAALSLVLCDIDFFKALNDTLGHAGGDQILRQFGTRLQHNLRRGIDWVARIGGEEFAIVLPETSYEHALEVARKLRIAVARYAVHLRRQNTSGHRQFRTVRPQPRPGRRTTSRAARAEDRRRSSLPQQARRPQSCHRYDVRRRALNPVQLLRTAPRWRKCTHVDASPCPGSGFALNPAPSST